MFWSIVVTGCEWNWILPVSDLVLNPRSASWRKSTVYGLNGLRPTLRVGAFHLNPRPSGQGRTLLLLRPLSVGRKAIASLSAKKYGTPYFSARKRTSKYSRSCSFIAQLRSLRETRPLQFFRVVRRGTPDLACWQRIRCSRLDPSLWLLHSFVSRFVPGIASISPATQSRGCCNCVEHLFHS